MLSKMPGRWRWPSHQTILNLSFNALQTSDPHSTPVSDAMPALQLHVHTTAERLNEKCRAGLFAGCKHRHTDTHIHCATATNTHMLQGCAAIRHASSTWACPTTPAQPRLPPTLARGLHMCVLVDGSDLLSLTRSLTRSLLALALSNRHRRFGLMIEGSNRGVHPTEAVG